jgi:hypothetical protein
VTTVDFTQYQPPGIFIEEETTPLVSVIGASGPSIVAVVGPSVGYRINTQAVTLTGTTAASLLSLGINPSSVVVSASDGTIYPNSAYTLTVGGGGDADISTTPDNTLTIARNGTGIPDGSTVFVSYQYTDATYFTPQTFQNYEDFKDVFGEPLNTVTSAVTSPISLAAKVAFENGARIVIGCACEGSPTVVTRSQIQDALDNLLAVHADLVVVCPVGLIGTEQSPGDINNVAADLATHCEAASNDTLFRIGLIGYEPSVTVNPNTTSSSVRSRRLIVAWPNQMSYFNGYANQTITIGGYYLAAAYAGVLAGGQVREPLTHKRIRSFSAIPQSIINSMSTPVKNTFAQDGVAVTERNRQGNLVVRHGVTTAIDALEHREVSIVRQRDALVTMLMTTMENANLIGSPIDFDTQARVKGVLTGTLEAAVTQQTIVAYSALKVRQRSLDPSVIEVKFDYLPAFPLNYIVVSFAINLQSGSTDLIDQTA